ncbi:MAG: 2-isopropylmalate synthase [Candidatus Delongbacteria bacterium]|nr:2-isopropylmalate synthase [Candidatus Delongbacteria bacterium]
MSKRIRIFDTTLRDGEQSPGASMSVDQKVEIAVALSRLGVDYIEAGFPVSSPVQFESVNRVSEAVQNTTIVALARCVKEDIDAARQSLKNAKMRRIHVFIATSPLHREYKLKMSQSQILDRIKQYMDYAGQFFDQIEFSAEDASRTEPDFLYEVVRTAIRHGAKAVNIPDTVGYAIPSDFGHFIRGICENVPEIKTIDLSVHCHNDLGLAVSNSIAAIENGATQIETTLNGIGERAGNCSLEELVMAFKVRQDYLAYQTGIKTELLYPTSKLLQSITGLMIARNKPIIGDNVFSHESGIHQDGVLKHKETYEIMKPADIGYNSETLVMGRHSGRHAFKIKLEQYGIMLSPEKFDQAFKAFTELADKKKEVFDEDILAIISSMLGKIQEGYQLEYFHVHTGNTLIPSATVKISKDQEHYVAASTGDGPVDALFCAIDKALSISPVLKDYQIQAVSSGKEATGQVRLVLSLENNDFMGKGTSTDIIEASAAAYVNAVNRYLYKSLFTAEFNGETI